MYVDNVDLALFHQPPARRLLNNITVRHLHNMMEQNPIIQLTRESVSFGVIWAVWRSGLL